MTGTGLEKWINRMGNQRVLGCSLSGLVQYAGYCQGLIVMAASNEIRPGISGPEHRRRLSTVAPLP